MGVGAGLSMYVVVVQKFTFAISSPDEFLSNRVVNVWNSLPNWVVSANTTNTFKARLDKF